MSKFKIGDRVQAIHNGHDESGVIVNIKKQIRCGSAFNTIYPIRVKWENGRSSQYGLCGSFYYDDDLGYHNNDMNSELRLVTKRDTDSKVNLITEMREKIKKLENAIKVLENRI